MTHILDEAFVGFLLETVQNAGNAIMDVYNSNFKIRTKVDSSPVTAADELGEKIIRLALENQLPEVPFVGEEAYAAGHRPELTRGLFWLVDALDGTKEFIKKSDEFTVNVALIENNLPIFGAVYAPAKNMFYWGSRFGAFSQRGDQDPKQISTRSPSKEGLTVTLSRTNGKKEDVYLKKFKVKSILTLGSSLKFCLIAAGEADLYPRLAPTSEWDTAAGHAVLSHAGGQVTQLDGSPFVYGKKQIINPYFLAKGSEF